MKKLEDLGIKVILYKRFKDDITIVAESLEKGSKLESEKIVIYPIKIEQDLSRNDEEISMEIIKEVAETIDDIIKFTFDTPQNHKSGKIPILDVEAKINKEKDNRIDFEFFQKPTKNKKVILESSALPSKQKRTILTQECLRRLRNTKVELGKDTQDKHLNNFMLQLKNSGYPIKFRKEVLDSSNNAFEKMLRDDQEGIKPLFRSREWNKEERYLAKKDKKLNWYKNSEKIEYKTVLIVPVTKDGKLLKELQQREEKVNKCSNERIKFIEDGGVRMRDLMVKKDPFPNMKCDKKKCVLCDVNEPSKMKFACNSNNVGYRLMCDTCIDQGKKKVYEGESSRSARLRGAEHFSGLRNCRMDNALYKHKLIEHPTEDAKFSMCITKKFRDPLTRQANEAVRISSRKRNELMHSKNEFNHPPITRISVNRDRRPKAKITG